MIEEFSIRIDHIIAAQEKSYYAERMKIDSMLSKNGTFRSSAAWTLTSELATNNLNYTVDECLKFALMYAGSEGIPHHELLNLAKAKLEVYKDKLFADLEKRVGQIGVSSIQKPLAEAKPKLGAIIEEKIKIAARGWVNSEKIYSGNLISPSLKFFNSVCLIYDDTLHAKAPQLKERFEAAYKNLESDNPSHWANAVHECRKIFEDLADVVFPTQDTPAKRGDKEIIAI